MSLDDVKKREVIAIISVGCSREMAARYVGCSPDAIGRAMKRDKAFAAQIVKAEEQSELYFVQRIRSAAEKDQYWRAAAWALERRIPHRYAARAANTITLEQLAHFMTQLAEIITGEIDDTKTRMKIIKRLGKITQSLMETSKKITITPQPDGDSEDKPAV